MIKFLILLITIQALKLRNKDVEEEIDDSEYQSISSLTQQAQTIISKTEVPQKTVKVEVKQEEVQKKTEEKKQENNEKTEEKKEEKTEDEKTDDNEKTNVKDKTNVQSDDSITAKDFEISTDDNESLAQEPIQISKPVDKSNLIQVKKLLSETAMEEIVGTMISRQDGLNHLLLSDVNLLLASIQNDFPDIAQVYSIGQSFEGRDINILELSTSGKAKKQQVEQVKQQALVQGDSSKVSLADEELIQLDDEDANKPSVLMTGATHARELISTSMNVYEMLKLIKLGAVQKDEKYSDLLAQNKYYFCPILNVDGVALIEQEWKKNKKIIPHRKSMDTKYSACQSSFHPDEDLGVDLNRNFGVDFGQVDPIVKFQNGNYDDGFDDGKHHKDPMKIEPCDYNFPGPQAFSEPETQAYKNFLTSKKDNLSFVMNVHSNGNAFIYPFNGRQKNDIEERRPGILNIFQEISQKAPFPSGEMKGTSKDLMGIAIGGDQDDWTLDALGVPSITAELGYVGQFINEWQVKDSGTANDILSEQSPWVEYVYKNLPRYQEVIQSHRKK